MEGVAGLAERAWNPNAMIPDGYLFDRTGRAQGAGDRGDGMSTEVLWNPHLPYHSSLTGQSAQELADEYEKSTGKQWTALGIGHSLFEVGIGALKAAAEPKNNKSVRESIAT